MVDPDTGKNIIYINRPSGGTGPLNYRIIIKARVNTPEAIADKFDYEIMTSFVFNYMGCPDDASRIETVTLPYPDEDEMVRAFPPNSGYHANSDLIQDWFIKKQSTAFTKCLHPRIVDNPISRQNYTHPRISFHQSYDMGLKGVIDTSNPPVTNPNGEEMIFYIEMP